MAASAAAIVALAVFWLLILGSRFLIGDSVIDTLPALIASICLAALVFRTVLRRRT
jgi:hypothetical protein